jgi:hypothetical protein
LAFAINQRPVSRDASSIAQTDVQHFSDEEVMRKPSHRKVVLLFARTETWRQPISTNPPET